MLPNLLVSIGLLQPGLHLLPLFAVCKLHALPLFLDLLLQGLLLSDEGGLLLGRLLQSQKRGVKIDKLENLFN